LIPCTSNDTKIYLLLLNISDYPPCDCSISRLPIVSPKHPKVTSFAMFVHRAVSETVCLCLCPSHMRTSILDRRQIDMRIQPLTLLARTHTHVREEKPHMPDHSVRPQPYSTTTAPSIDLILVRGYNTPHTDTHRIVHSTHIYSASH
jgi:hypothetical protein